MSIGTNIKKYRNAANLTQSEFAAALSVSRSAVAQWESGYSTPLIGNVKAMAKVLKVDVVDLMAEEISEIRENAILYYIDALNAEGQERALEYIKDLSEMPKYRK